MEIKVNKKKTSIVKGLNVQLLVKETAQHANYKLEIGYHRQESLNKCVKTSIQSNNHICLLMQNILSVPWFPISFSAVFGIPLLQDLLLPKSIEPSLYCYLIHKLWGGEMINFSLSQRSECESEWLDKDLNLTCSFHFPC